jgi:uncharacterized protein YbjT (DUF2867 family)
MSPNTSKNLATSLGIPWSDILCEHRILLTGGTGQLGTAAVKVLCRHGWQVWVLTRNPASDKAQAVATVGATLIGGNLNDRDALQAAMSGMVVPLVTSYDPL